MGGLGGFVTVALAETYPHRDDGTVTLDGRRGGATLDQSGFDHVQALLDVLFPDLIDPFTVDERAVTQPGLMAFHQALQARMQADPSALQRLASVHLSGSERLDPAGVGLPLLSLRPSWDCSGGIIHVWAYGQAVESAGAQASNTNWLIDDIGPREAAEALRALVEWAETGVQPPQPTVP